MFLDPALRAPIAISLGAIAGALSRYYLSTWLTTSLMARFGLPFPYGTFIINLTGCLAMGFFMTIALEKSFSPELRLLIATGFLGAYTTFSTYGLETVSLISQNQTHLATLYATGSAILGIILVQLGAMLAKIGQ
jgi:fluoride exporter